MYTPYQAIYQDKFGKEKTKIILDDKGHQMKIFVRGVEFSGASFNRLSPNDINANLERFLIDNDGHLHSFSCNVEIPVSFIDREQTVEGLLRINCKIDSPENNWEDDHLQLGLSFNEMSVQSNGGDSGVEDEMFGLANKLPKGIYVKTCFNCRYSDYNPYFNSGLMGELVCFVNREDKDNTKRDKGYPGWRNAEPDFVQEFFLCPEFQPKQFLAGRS